MTSAGWYKHWFGGMRAVRAKRSPHTCPASRATIMSLLSVSLAIKLATASLDFVDHDEWEDSVNKRLRQLHRQPEPETATWPPKPKQTSTRCKHVDSSTRRQSELAANDSVTSSPHSSRIVIPRRRQQLLGYHNNNNDDDDNNSLFTNGVTNNKVSADRPPECGLTMSRAKKWPNLINDSRNQVMRAVPARCELYRIQCSRAAVFRALSCQFRLFCCRNHLVTHLASLSWSKIKKKSGFTVRISTLS